MANRTSIVIAHRLSTIVGADQILVLDQAALSSGARTRNCSCWIKNTRSYAGRVC